MGDGNQDRVEAALGPDVSPGETVSATLHDDSNPEAHSHSGHSDFYTVTKDAEGKVSSEKGHTDGESFW
jgi:hypothetical protein